jgi:hypothetical protein
LHVNAGRQVAFYCAFQRTLELFGLINKFTIAAKTTHYLVVANITEFTSYQALRPIITKLNLMLGVPARIIAYYRDK